MKRVVIFTTNSVEKLHPRIEMEAEILKLNGFSVRIIKTTERSEGFFWELINVFTLKYFKWRAINQFKKELDFCDVAHIYDLQLLPLVKKAYKKNKFVIYETLDDSVHLIFFALAQRIKGLTAFKKIVTGAMASYERKISNRYCSKVIVNSPNLISKFDSEKVVYIPYSSPLEGLRAQKFSNQKETVFLYLGKLTEGKGARIYKDLLARFQKKLIFFGNTQDTFSKVFTAEDDRVIHIGNLTSVQLKSAIAEVLLKYNVIGLSIIFPENESYQWQEANKDIDYITMGIPFIGNDRPPTLEKINKGVGVLYNDYNNVNKLQTNEGELYNSCSNKCHELAENYRFEKFKKEFLLVYGKY